MSERQEVADNKVTSYITAIDCFFAEKGEPVTRDVTEGVALVLGSTLEQRRSLVARMNQLYNLRSTVSHRGERVADEDAATDLKTLAIDLLAALCAMSNTLLTKAALRIWLIDRRLST
jgi:hypothetical protein